MDFTPEDYEKALDKLYYLKKELKRLQREAGEECVFCGKVESCDECPEKDACKLYMPMVQEHLSNAISVLSLAIQHLIDKLFDKTVVVD